MAESSAARGAGAASRSPARELSRNRHVGHSATREPQKPREFPPARTSQRHPFMLRFERGTLCIDAPDDVASRLPGVLWDPRSLAWRAPAHRAPEIVRALPSSIARPWSEAAVPFRKPELRPYQRDALTAWLLAERHGVIVLPTGAGKTRTAIAAAAEVGGPTAILCPTRALVEQWVVELRPYYDGLVGCFSDGVATLGPVTVLTFESAYRRMDAIGQRFLLLIVDEVHHFETGARAEALECSTAPFRLGLTATPPAVGSRVDELIGPTVHHVAMHELVGGALSKFELLTLHVTLDADERARYESAYSEFAEARGAILRSHPQLEWSVLVAALGRTEAGRHALRGYQRAVRIASLPSAKRRAVHRLVHAHRKDKALVFAASTDDAYRIGRDVLAPVITADTVRKERETILALFRDGSIDVVVSARVLNEGIDVPDAAVAIVAGGTLGARELKQRMGRVLRLSPGKETAMIYEVCTLGTIDERRANARRRKLDELG